MNFKELIKTWTTEISSLKETLLLNHLVNLGMLGDEEKKFRSLIEEKCIKTEVKSDTDFTYKIPDSVYPEWNDKKAEVNKLVISCSILPRMFIVTLVCQYDALIGNLMKLVLVNKPEILNNSEKNITFSQLSNFRDIEEAKEYIIAKEIETCLRENHDEQLKWFERKLDIKLHENKKLLETFFELTERRNLYTHNNGIVNESYLNNCKKYNISTNCQLGDVLLVDPEYFQQASECILEIGIKLSVILWRKIFPNENKESESITNQIAYGFIKSKDYELALTILDFGLECFKPFKANINKYMFIINKAQSLLWLKKEDQVKKILDLQDWSLCTPQFILCKTVLERNFDEAIEILKKQQTDLDQIDLLSWPIFKELREQQKFKEYLAEKYPDPIENDTSQISDNIVEAQIQLENDIF